MVRATLPVVAGLPSEGTLGEELLAVVRDEYTIGYWPLAEPERYAWRGPAYEARLDGFKRAGSELAAFTFDILRAPPCPRSHGAVTVSSAAGPAASTRGLGARP
jgi:hypothetical protein